MQKIVKKFIKWTSVIETDEYGVEHLKPWTLEEFLLNFSFFLAGMIMGVIVTLLLL